MQYKFLFQIYILQKKYEMYLLFRAAIRPCSAIGGARPSGGGGGEGSAKRGGGGGFALGGGGGFVLRGGGGLTPVGGGALFFACNFVVYFNNKFNKKKPTHVI